MKIVFLGTSSGIPTFDRNVSSIALVLDNKKIWLFDCGEGTQHQLMKAGLSFQKIERIFITHLHGDHFFGLPGLLAMRAMKKVTEPLQVYGPEGIQGVLETLAKATQSYYSYPMTITELTQVQLFDAVDEIEVKAFPILHRVPCWGYVLKETDRPGKFSTEKAISLGVPKGPLLAQLSKGNSVTLADGSSVSPFSCAFDSTPGRHLVILGDTCDPSSLTEDGMGCDLLIHEATFEAKETDLAMKSGHSTTTMAAEFALKIKAKNLVITHFSARYESTDQLVQEAQDTCKDSAQVYAAHDFLAVHVLENHTIKVEPYQPKREKQ